MTLEPESCPRCEKPLPICVCDRVEPVATRLRIVVLQHPQEDNETLGTKNVQRERWAVLAAAKLLIELPDAVEAGGVVVVDRNGHVLPLDQHRLDGILVLDGTWSQAKTLWWRNAWLLKLPRIVMTPREPSMYGRLRKEPRRDYVSTLEAIADVLPALGEPEQVRDSLRRLLRTLLQRARDAGRAKRQGGSQ